MTYCIADIHGCYAEYRELVEKLALSPEDTLYILGDAMDRGPEPIQVIRDIMGRSNVFYLMGNHDAMMLAALRQLAVEITEESIKALDQNAILCYLDWMNNGGEVTLTQFRALPAETREDILSFLEQETSYYETVEVAGHLYLLVHAGLDHFAPGKELDEYADEDFLWARPDYGRDYFPGGRITLITGHTPTPLIRSDRKPLIYAGHGHLALDCGCVFGGQLAAYCLETGAVTYVPSQAYRERLAAT